jgi:small subunit ribosomal protein S2
MRELLEAGVHFGHQTRRWNPKMRRFIFGERGGIYIIDLQKTLESLEEAQSFVRNLAERGGTVLFVGTKKQAQDSVEEEAKRTGMPYVNHRWLGGLLTNWRTISERIEHLHELRRLRDEGQLDLLPPKERISMQAELEKLEANLGGVADMRKQPDAIFIVDLRKEQLAVKEARRLTMPVIALVDTNCDPDEADFVIPGNDDAIRSCSLVVHALGDAITEGKQRADYADRIEQLENELSRHRDLESLLRTTLVSAEKSAHELKDQAKREAELVIGEAHAEARAVTRTAAAERERLLAEARKVRALLEAALGAVDDADADAQAA